MVGRRWLARAGAPPLPWTESWPRRAAAEAMRRLQAMHPLRRVMTVILLVGILAIPLFGAVSAYQDYQQLKTLGQDAVHHLLAAKDALLPSGGSSSSLAGGSCSAGTAHPATPTASATHTPSAAPTATPGGQGSGASGAGHVGIPDAAQLDAAKRELMTAQQEFNQVGLLLDHPDPTLAVAGDVPFVQNDAGTARQLVYLGDDVTSLGVNMLTAAEPVLLRLRTGVLANTQQPLITHDEAAQLRTVLLKSLSTLNDVELRISMIDPSQLPLSACQKSEYASLTRELPLFKGLIDEAPGLFDALTWVIGVDHQRQFLVQTMDRNELRPTGGFTGQFGVLTLNGGRVAPFILRDVDDVYLNTPYSYRPPDVYSWWPFARWGLRDSNLSADFPTTAQLNINLFEGAQHIWKTIGQADPTLDGVIEFTPQPVADVLTVAGPIAMPQFGETVTAANVEQLIYLWQNDAGYRARENAICAGATDNPNGTARKCFTTRLATALENQARKLSISQLLTLAKMLIADMKNHEIEVYVTDPKVEALLVQDGYASKLATAPGQDTLTVNQANVSVNKISPNIVTTLTDDVTLDAKGGATHKLEISLHNNPSLHQYLDAASYITTYRDYVRVYVPQQAQLQDANGFATGRPVCWEAPPYHAGESKPTLFAQLPNCWSNLFPDQSLVCPAGAYGPGPRQDSFAGDGKTDWAVEDTGWPTDYVSDVPGLAMWGSYVIVPQNCTAHVTLTYYVPNVALPSSAVPASAPAYTYLIERQAGTDIQAKVTIHPAANVPGELNQTVQVQAPLTSDLTVTLGSRSKPVTGH